MGKMNDIIKFASYNSASKIDLFISSPYMILVIVIVAILIAAIYRKLRYG